LKECILLKCPLYTRRFTDSMQSSLKYLLQRDRKKNSKIHVEPQTYSQTPEAILSKKKKAGVHTVPYCKAGCKAIVTKTAWHWHKTDKHFSD
jgi:hypothetical protein